MQNIGIVIWRFSPLHIWHISLINQSLKINDKTIVIIWSANVIDENNPYTIEERQEILSQEFWKQIILETLNDSESNEKWMENLWKLLDKYCNNKDNLNFFWWDLENDYAIKVIKKLSPILGYKKINFFEKNRNEIPISWTKIRDLIKEKKFEETKKWLSKKTTSIILK